MPRKFLFTREEIIAAALELVQERGMAALTARGLGERLGTSAKPIFGLFQNMEEVSRAVIDSAWERYQQYLTAETEAGKYPPYKARGMAYIRFAGEQTELFRLLFMRDRSREEIPTGHAALEPELSLVRENTALGEDDAAMFHLEMWVVVHGIASMIATAYVPWDEETVSRMLTDLYLGLQARYQSEVKADGSH